MLSNFFSTFCQYTILSRAVDWNFQSCFLGRAGNLKAAAETLKSAESLRISIGADAMRFYLQFVKDYRKKKDSGIFAQLSDLFRNNKKK